MGDEKLDDGWPESVEEQSLLLLVWRHAFYTQALLHTDAFTHRRFLHAGAFTHRSFYTQTLLHTDPFTHRRFYTQTLLHTDAFYTQALLHTETFTHRGFYPQRLLHTDAFTRHVSDPAQSLLWSCRASFWTPKNFSPTAECFGVFSHSKGFGADPSSSKTHSPKVPRFQVKVPRFPSKGSQVKLPN